MPQVTVTAVALICGKWQVNAVCLTVCNLGFSGIHGPLIITPSSNDFQVRSQGLDAKLKTNLVITLAGSTVADCSSAFLAGNFYQLLSDTRTCHRGSK
jgi:hypothetical protein